MGQISPETIQAVLAATHIEELIQSYVPLRRAGSAFKGLCPFHNEKSPSFTVNPQRQFFHCFGCGKSGDAIAFLREFENLPFDEAVKKLASRAGVPVVEGREDPNVTKNRRLKSRLIELHRVATEFFHQQLLRNPNAEHARSYWKSRGFSREMAERWKVGWMPDQGEAFLELMREKKFTGRELIDSGIANFRDETRPSAGLYVRFLGRLMFPICDEMGEVIAFSGRKLREEQGGGKYINSPETALFKKSHVFFGLDRAKKAILREKTALLCEGQLDAICCHEYGFSHVIAPLGTAFTEHHARLLRRYTKSVTLCYDGDQAGILATEKAFRILTTEGLEVKAIALPAGSDPDSLLRERGEAGFRELLERSVEFFDYKLDLANQQNRDQDVGERTKLIDECAQLLASMTDAIARSVRIQHVAARLRIAPNLLIEAVQQILTREKAQQRRVSTAQAKRDHANASSEEISPASPPIRLPNQRVLSLCQLALSSRRSQQVLEQQFEFLYNAREFLQGFEQLEQILEIAPDPAIPAQINVCLADFSNEMRQKLQQFLTRSISEQAIEDELQGIFLEISSLQLEQQKARLVAQLEQHQLTIEQKAKIFEELRLIQEMSASAQHFAPYQDSAAQMPYHIAKKQEKAWREKKT